MLFLKRQQSYWAFPGVELNVKNKDKILEFAADNTRVKVQRPAWAKLEGRSAASNPLVLN
jgi:hypothetical protein